ncbi:hypothetical protein ACQKWADRAFT_312791 [Trichoderma austrokoningii]
MQFSQIIALAALAAPLALAAPAPAPATPATPATIDLSSDLTTSPHYATALWQVKEKFPNLSEEDANTAALGYLEAIGVQITGASNSTALAERDIEKRCCSGCDNGNCIIAIFVLGFCCI